MSDIEIVEATEVDAEIVEAFQRLVPQLSNSSSPPTQTDLEEILASRSVLLLARDRRSNGQIVGSLTMVVFRIPTGLRVRIEDVVVDGEARGRGIGAALSTAALQRARELGAKSVDLTTRPSREAANRLYERLGFSRRDTNVYRFTQEP